MKTSAEISGLVLLAAGLFGACAGEETDEETEVADQAAMDELQADLDVGPLVGGPDHGMGPAAFFRCDPDPDIELGSLCGRTVPVSAHFEWAECESEMGTSSGTADIATASEDCAAGIEHQVAFAVSHPVPFGDGGTATASGDLVIALARSGADRSATVNGGISVALPFGEAAIAMTDVVRVPPTECRYPIAGSVTHTLPDGTSHILAFGPACGQGTADGEPVDLATWHPPGPGPGGGF
jgi:hypothetical protein